MVAIHVSLSLSYEIIYLTKKDIRSRNFTLKTLLSKQQTIQCIIYILVKLICIIVYFCLSQHSLGKFHNIYANETKYASKYCGDKFIRIIFNVNPPKTDVTDN